MFCKGSSRLKLTSTKAVKQVLDLTDGLGAYAVIVVVGVEDGYHLGVQLLRPTGTLVCVGIPRMDFHIPISPLDCINRGMRQTEASKDIIFPVGTDWIIYRLQCRRKRGWNGG